MNANKTPDNPAIPAPNIKLCNLSQTAFLPKALTASSSSLTALNARPQGELLSLFNNSKTKNIEIHERKPIQICPAFKSY